MEEDIMSFIMEEIDGIRANRNRSFLSQLGEDFEPFQFYELDQIDMEELFQPEEDVPASKLMPFVLMGQEGEDYQEFGFGVWNINLN